MLLDTASDKTIVSKNTWKILSSPGHPRTNNKARNASGGKIKLLGEYDCELTIPGKRDHGTIYIVGCELNLLGIDWIDRLELSDMLIDQLCSSTPAQIICPICQRKIEMLARLNKLSAVSTDTLG